MEIAEAERTLIPAYEAVQKGGKFYYKTPYRKIDQEELTLITDETIATPVLVDVALLDVNVEPGPVREAVKAKYFEMLDFGDMEWHTVIGALVDYKDGFEDGYKAGSATVKN